MSACKKSTLFHNSFVKYKKIYIIPHFIHRILLFKKSCNLTDKRKNKLHRYYSSFNEGIFKEDLGNNLQDNSITKYSYYQFIFFEILKKCASIKKYIPKLNYNPFMVKHLRQATMHSQNEVDAQRYSVKNVFLEILENSQENTCARVSFLMKL